MWLPSAARWIKVNLEHIALIFKLYFSSFSLPSEHICEAAVPWQHPLDSGSRQAQLGECTASCSRWACSWNWMLGWKAGMDRSENTVCSSWGWQLKPFSSQQDFRLSWRSSSPSLPYLEMLKQSSNIYSCIWSETNLWITLHLSYNHLSFTVLFKIFLLALLWTKLLAGAVPKQETGLKGCHPSALWEAGHQWINPLFSFLGRLSLWSQEVMLKSSYVLS